MQKQDYKGIWIYAEHRNGKCILGGKICAAFIMQQHFFTEGGFGKWK